MTGIFISRHKKILKYTEEKNFNEIKKILCTLDFHEIAQHINRLKKCKLEIFHILSPEIQSEVIIALNENSKKEILPKMSVIAIASFLHFNDEDDATDILQNIDKMKQDKILSKIAEKKRLKIQRLLSFAKDSAGGLMDLNYIIVKESFTFEDIASKVHEHIEKEHKVPYVILTTTDGKIIGQIPHKNLLFAGPKTPIKLITRKITTIKYSQKQSEIIKNIKNKTDGILGVTDETGIIIGVIHIEDLINVIQSETTKSLFSFAGVKKEELLTDPVWSKVKMRYQWLIINLATAFLASSVVSIFEDTITKISLLAVFMPIVAGQGGNSATQALAVTVRGLSTGVIDWQTAKSVILNEASAGIINGLIIGLIATLIASLIGAPVMLGLILGFSMIINLGVAGLFGALIPFILKSLKIDPAVASSVFVTTITDIVGFFVFLGLGTALLL